MAKKKNNNLWYILGGVVIVVLVLWIILANVGNNQKSSQDNLKISCECEFDLVVGQFGGTSGSDSISCVCRNIGTSSGEKCFNVLEIKTQNSVESILSQHKICSGDLSNYESSEKIIITEPQTYRDFENYDCAISGINSERWSCNVRDSESEIQYTIQIEKVD